MKINHVYFHVCIHLILILALTACLPGSVAPTEAPTANTGNAVPAKDDAAAASLPTPTVLPPTKTPFTPTSTPTLTPEPEVFLLEQDLPLDDVFLTDASFFDAETGWVVGFRDTGNFQNLPAILHTNDGSTWTEQDPGFTEGSLNTIFFTSATEGYAGGQDFGEGSPVILHTTDGGATWSRMEVQQLHGSVNELTFTEDGIGWAGGSEFDTIHSMLLKLVDGVWQTVEHPSSEEGMISAISFLNNQTGYMVGTAGYEISSPFVLKTTDGGNTWISLTPPVEEGTLADLHFEDENTGWVVGNSGDDGLVAMTTDGGNTWEITRLSGSTVYLKAIIALGAGLLIAGNICTDFCTMGLWAATFAAMSWTFIGAVPAYSTFMVAMHGMIIMALLDSTGETLPTFLATAEFANMFIKLALLLGVAALPVLLFPILNKI